MRGFAHGLAALLFSGLFVSPAHAEPTLLDGIAAVVNDDIVLISQLEREVNVSPYLAQALQSLGPSATPQQAEQLRREVRAEVLDELIEVQLIKREAARFQITISETDVDHYIKQMTQQNGFSSVDQLRTAVLESGQFGSWADYRQMVRDQILVYQTTGALTNYKVSEAQVREHYRKMARDVDAKVEVAQLVFNPPAGQGEAREGVYTQAQAIARRLRAGEEVEVIAAELGQDEVVQELGRGKVAPQLEDAIFAAKQGQVVGPLASGQGFVVYKILSRDDAEVLSFEQARDRIRAMLEQEALERASKEFREQLRAKAHIDIRI